MWLPVEILALLFHKNRCFFFLVSVIFNRTRKFAFDIQVKFLNIISFHSQSHFFKNYLKAYRHLRSLLCSQDHARSASGLVDYTWLVIMIFFTKKKLGGTASVHMAIDSNVKCLRLAVSVEKNFLKLFQKFRENFSQNFLSKLTVIYDYFPDIYLKFLITKLFPKIFPKYKKISSKSPVLKVSSEFPNIRQFSQNFGIHTNFL